MESGEDSFTVTFAKRALRRELILGIIIWINFARISERGPHLAADPILIRVKLRTAPGEALMNFTFNALTWPCQQDGAVYYIGFMRGKSNVIDMTQRT